jgi:signal peptidase I
VTAAYLEAFKLPAGSMMPTLLVGDHIYVAKYDRTPAAGDVIVFVYPKDPSKSFVKRVVGMPGDVVELKDGGLLVNGVATATSTGTPCTVYDYNEMLERWEVKRPTCRDEVLGEHHFQTLHEETSRDFPPFTVPPAHYFVLGDNRDNSHDSRYWGPVPAENVLGTASFIWWSTGEPEGVRFARLNQIVR